MDTEHKGHIKYVIGLILKELLVAAVLGIILSIFAREYLTGINYEGLLQALVALNSGIIIAMFVALFHSPNKNIESFKKFTRAAKQVYLIFLVNSAIACISVMLINNIDSIQSAELPNQIVFNIFAALAAAVATAKNVHLVYRLLQINFRTS
jgi:Na+/H+-dicarboxylate symporter